MIKWILFDQAKVQTYNIFSRHKFYFIHGKQFSAKELESIFYIPEYRKFIIGEMSERKFISIFLKKSNLQLSVKDYIKIFKKGIEPINGMKEVLEKLQKKINLATLINESSEWANYKLDISGFRKFFKKNFISGDLNFVKPNPKIYKIVLKKLNAKPEECLFIDDRKENCDAAIKLGIKSIMFKNSNQLKKELATLSINLD